MNFLTSLSSLILSASLTLAAETAFLPNASVKPDTQPFSLSVSINDIYCHQTACDCIGDIATREYQEVFDLLKSKYGITIQPVYFPEDIDLEKAILAKKTPAVICKPWFALRHEKATQYHFQRVVDITDPNGSATMAGMFLVNASSSIQSIQDTNNLRFVFGKEDAYEKFVDPQLFLKSKNISPKSALHFSSCGENIDALLSHKVDVAVVSDYALTASCAVDFVKPGELRTIAKTEPIPLTSLMVDSSALTPEQLLRLQQALLEITQKNLPKSFTGKGFVKPQPWSPQAPAQP